jgi:integrase
MVRLTDAYVAKLETNGKDRLIFDGRQPGFAIRVTPTGTKIFVAQSRVAGRKRRVTVGYYPAINVSVARESALHTLANMRQGIDPVAAQRARLAGKMSMSELADKWLADYVRPKLKPRTVFDYEQLLAKHIRPAVGLLAVAHISRDDVTRLHVAMQRTPRRANYVIAILKALLNFAIDLGLRPVGSNPARRVRLYREKMRERFLSEEEIGKAAEAITNAEQTGIIGPHAAAGLRLCLFTGCRRGEACAIEWSHIDWDRRLIRLPDSKNNVPRTIHLSDAAIEVLKVIPRTGRFVIAGRTPEQPFQNLTETWIRVRGLAGLEDCRLHDLRHSFASLAAGRGVSLQMIGKLLGHRSQITTQRYAHLSRDAASAVNDELGAAMQAAIAKKRPPSGKVLKLPRLPRGRR